VLLTVTALLVFAGEAAGQRLFVTTTALNATREAVRGYTFFLGAFVSGRGIVTYVE